MNLKIKSSFFDKIFL